MRCLIVLLLGIGLAMPAAAQNFVKGKEASDRGDYEAALREWRPLAEQGDAVAQHNLGFMYLNGQGVAQDPAATELRLFGTMAYRWNKS